MGLAKNLVIPGGVPVDTLGASENRVDTPCQGRVPVLSMLAQELAANHQHRRGVLKFTFIGYIITIYSKFSDLSLI